MGFLLFLIFICGIALWAYQSPTHINKLKFISLLTPNQREIVKKHFPYYSKLNYAHKLEFEKRLNYFLENKEFIARKMSSVTEEMKLLIGACAVQLTFGFQPLKLVHFEKIILFPSQYYSSITKKTHRGEVSSSGFIVLSWEDFIRGYKIPNDGINLGLHEMAHALQLEDLVDDEEYEFIDMDALQHWHAVSLKEYRKIKRGEKSFLRSYAGKDHNEFFAVCVEQFFEQPEEFKKQLPLLFEALSKVLKQNPLDPNHSIKLI